MVYVDTSVVLAQLLVEDVLPPASLWSEPLVSSRLLEYETWTRVNREGPDKDLAESARHVLSSVSFVELVPEALERALESWPTPVRTLDALHLTSLVFLRDRRLDVLLATFDERMRTAARRLDAPLYPLGD